MKIAMFTNNYKPFVGGVPISIERLKDELIRQGHEVYVFAPTYEEQLEEDSVIRYPSLPGKVGGAVIPNCFTKRMEKEVLRLGIEVIHVHHPLLVGNTALHLKKKYGIPVTFTYHTRYEQYLHYILPFKNMGYKTATKIVEKYIHYFANQCDYIYAPTPEIAQYLQEQEIETEIGVLPTGLLAEEYIPDENHVKEIKARYKENATYLFSCVARLAPEKNLIFLLQSMAEFKKLTKTTFRLMLIGDGPQREELKNIAAKLGIEKEIQFTGTIPNEQMKDYLAASDAFVFSSKSETQGIVLLEAMAVGNPIIAVDASGVCDLVEQGVNGYKVVEDPVCFAKTLFLILNNYETYFSMRQNAYLIARTYQQRLVIQKALWGYKTACCNREINHRENYHQKRSYAS